MADLYILDWNDVTNANQYVVEANAGDTGWATVGTTSSTQMVVVNTSTTYKSNIKYRVKAQDTTGVYDDSEYSDILSVTFYSVTSALTNLTIDNAQQMVASGYPYNSVITADTGYVITDDTWSMTINAVVDKTKGTIASDGKTLTIAVTNPAGNIVIGAWGAVQQLEAPTTINLTDGVLTWNNVTNNNGYEIVYRRVDGSGDIYQTDNVAKDVTTHTLTVTTSGKYTVNIVTVGASPFTDSEESATATYTVEEQLATPTIAMNSDGITLEITDVDNATSYDIYVDSVYKANVAKSVPDVAKGDLLNIDLNGDGTTEQYRVVSIDGTNAQIVAMAEATSMEYELTQVYANSSVDTYLNSTWYNTLSDTAKAAIVDKTFRQASWYRGSSGSPVYNGYYGTLKPGTSSYSLSLANASFGSEITRHVYALSVQDVIDYVTDTDVTDGQIQNYNIWKMFWNDEVSHSEEDFWLRCANADDSRTVFHVHGNSGDLERSRYSNSDSVRPALTIDLSKISYTK